MSQMIAKHDIAKTIVIDHDKCRRCGMCAKACTTKLLQKYDKESHPEPLAARVVKTWKEGNLFNYESPTCANCRVCVITCPREAINIIATTKVW